MAGVHFKKDVEIKIPQEAFDWAEAHKDDDIIFKSNNCTYHDKDCACLDCPSCQCHTNEDGF